MFENQFYPTPVDLLRQIMPYVDNYKSVLDPSAGKGDILDYVTQNSYTKPERYAIEINPELQATLQGKHYTVLDSDFLSYNCDRRFDYILMNPPFAQGAKHFLKAWEISNDTNIVCILNAETIRNPYSKERQLVQKIVEDNGGEINYYKTAFISAERKTDVEVAVIRVYCSPKSHFDFDMEEEQQSEYTVDETKELQQPDAVTDIVDSYNKAVEHAKKAAYHLSKVNEYQNLMVEYPNKPTIELDTPEQSMKNIIDSLKSSVWSHIFKRLDLQKHMTSKFRYDFQSKVNKQKNMAINETNIKALVDILFQTRSQIFDQGVLEVFEQFTKYHEDNRIHVEGWKSNSIYMVNRKVVLPYYLELREWSKEFDISYRLGGQLTDIDKVMSYLTGMKCCCSIKQALELKFKSLGSIEVGQKFDNTADSTFFNIKFFKKGTLHLEFRKKEYWDALNLAAMKGNAWLPPGKTVKNGKFVDTKEITIL